MKKFLLIIFIIAAVVIYSLFQRKNVEKKPMVISNKVVFSKPKSTPASANIPSSAPSNAPSPAPQATGYKDGVYTGNAFNVFYGNVQIQASIANGKITKVQILQYPSDHSTSVYINNQAMPYLISEAIQAQNANVNVISGATLTSEGFAQSLQSALNQAKN